VPSASVGLANNVAVTTATVIGLTWNNGISTGGSPIIDYRVSYDQSTGVYVVLGTGIVPRSYSTTVTLTPGAIYKFRVEARNSVGYSATSTAFSILAAQPPTKPSAPVTTASEGNIVVSWTAPYNGGSTITSYSIFFRHNDELTFTESPTICDGTQSTVISERACTVSNYDMNAAPFNLAWGSIIFVKVTATNIKGSSTVSEAGNGAIILRAPDAPISFINEDTITDEDQIGMSWSDGTWDGGSAVIDYKISFTTGISGAYTILETGVLE
jgi:hypothetical protein